jgi:hypothetical protein
MFTPGTLLPDMSGNVYQSKWSIKQSTCSLSYTPITTTNANSIDAETMFLDNQKYNVHCVHDHFIPSSRRCNSCLQTVQRRREEVFSATWYDESRHRYDLCHVKRVKSGHLTFISSILRYLPNERIQSGQIIK